MIIKNHLIFTALLLFCLCSCNKNNSYKIIGDFSDIKGEGIAIISNYKNFNEEEVPFIDGHFEFTGEQKRPEIYRILLKGPHDSVVFQMKSDLLYIENGTITCSGSYPELYSLIGNYDKSHKRMNIVGGKENKLYNDYLKQTRGIVSELSLISKSLSHSKKPLYEMTDNEINDAINTQQKLQLLLDKRDQIKDTFIEKYPSSQLAYDLAFASMSMNRYYDDWIDEGIAHKEFYPVDLPIPTNAKVTKWLQLLKEQNPFFKSQLDTLNTLAKTCERLAPGASFMDEKIRTTNGEFVNLSSQLKQGKYTLIDCWASWCHPCRAYIPHVKKMYVKYQSEGLNVISVSQDYYDLEPSKNKWLKAVKEENMPWPQFQANDKEGFMKAYHVESIPNIIIISPDKKIVKLNVRGLELDMILRNIYGY